METDPRFDENDMMDGQDLPLGHKKFLLMRRELLSMIRSRELTRTRSHQLLAMLSEACDANFTRGYRCGTDDCEESIRELKRERDEARRRICCDSLIMGNVYRRVGKETVRLHTPEEVADMMEWDCFKETTND